MGCVQPRINVHPEKCLLLEFNSLNDQKLIMLYLESIVCSSDQTGRVKCPIDPFFIVPEKCKCVDFQTLKLQEAPEAVPNGELPRHLQLYCDRYLCDRVVPGNRVTVIGIYCIKMSGAAGKVGHSSVSPLKKMCQN